MVNTKPNKSTQSSNAIFFIGAVGCLFLGIVFQFRKRQCKQRTLTHPLTHHTEVFTNAQLLRAHSYTNHVNIVTTFLTDSQIVCSQSSIRMAYCLAERERVSACRYPLIFYIRWRTIWVVRCIAESNTKPHTTYTHNAIESKWMYSLL